MPNVKKKNFNFLLRKVIYSHKSFVKGIGISINLGHTSLNIIENGTKERVKGTSIGWK